MRSGWAKNCAGHGVRSESGHYAHRLGPAYARPAAQEMFASVQICNAHSFARNLPRGLTRRFNKYVAEGVGFDKNEQGYCGWKILGTWALKGSVRCIVGPIQSWVAVYLFHASGVGLRRNGPGFFRLCKP